LDQLTRNQTIDGLIGLSSNQQTLCRFSVIRETYGDIVEKYHQ